MNRLLRAHETGARQDLGVQQTVPGGRITFPVMAP
jgi:hypothetical protein